MELRTEPVKRDEESFFVSGRHNISVHKGDTVMATTTQSGAHGPFPCGRADLQIVLVFGSDEKLRDRLIERFYKCP